MSSGPPPPVALVNSGGAAAGGGAIALEFTVLERPVVAKLTGSRAPLLAPMVTAVFADLAPRTAPDRRPDLALDADQGDAAVLERLGQELCRQAVALRRHDLLMLHACAVSDPDTGAVVGLVGRSGAGKSTAVSLLARRWRYVTDEVLAIRDDLGVVVCPKPVSLVVPGESDKRQVPARDLRLEVAAGPNRLVGLLMLDRRPGGETVVEVMPTLDALATLAPQVSYLGARPRPLHRMAHVVKATGGLRRVSYQEADELVPVVDRILRGAP